MPTTNYYIPGIAQKTELVLLSYVSSSLSGSGLIPPDLNFYAGTANDDKDGPAVVIACESSDETYWNTRVYRCSVNVTTKESAADNPANDSTNTGSMMSLAGNIHAMFGNSNTASAGINQMVSGSSADYFVYQTQLRSSTTGQVGDAWIGNLNVDIICALVSYNGGS